MNELAEKYHQAKVNSKEYMKNGQISAYLGALSEMQKYKRLMVAILAN